MIQVIASQELEILEGGVVTGKVLVQLEKPYEAPGGEFHCAFTIDGINLDYPPYAVGEDSMQALILALSMIQSSLEASTFGRQGQLTWFGSTDLGFSKG